MMKQGDQAKPATPERLTPQRQAELLAVSGLAGKRVLVVGLGATGLSVVRFLDALDVTFEIADDYISDERLQETLMAAKAGLQTDPQTDLKIHRTFSDELFQRFDVLMVSPGVPLTTPELEKAATKAGGVELLGDIELFARINTGINKLQPSKHSKTTDVIAVTGSNGKSTVVAWLGHILAGSDLGVAVAGNIGKPVLDLLIESGTAFDVVVIELSSFQLELVNELNSLGSVVLNISEDHMDRYTSLEAYAQVKARIHANSNHVVLNRTDSLSWPAELPASANVVLFSSGALVSSEESDALSSLLASHQVVQITLQHVDDAEWLSINEKPLLPVAEIGLAGRHNVDNALAVIALLLPYTLSESLLRERIASFGGLPHRMQLVEEINGVRWFNDSKGTNVDACAKAIDGIAAPVVLLAGGLAKGADFSVLREPVARSVRALVLFGQDADSIAQVLSDLVDCHHVNDMQQAVEAADGIARQGDVVLLSPACASFDMFDSFEHRGNVFIDEVRRLAA